MSLPGSRFKIRYEVKHTVLTYLIVFLAATAAAGQPASARRTESDSLLHFGTPAGGTVACVERRVAAAVRMNLLLPLFNVGVEVPVGRFSVGADWYYPWLGHGSNNRDCLEALALSLEGRYWFVKGRTALTGHSVGLSAHGYRFDAQLDGEGSQGRGWGVGVDYTYALPLAQGRLRMEFRVGLGLERCTLTDYRVYTDGGPLMRPSDAPDRIVTWVGPNRAAVALVVPIFTGRRTAL